MLKKEPRANARLISVEYRPGKICHAKSCLRLEGYLDFQPASSKLESAPLLGIGAYLMGHQSVNPIVIRNKSCINGTSYINRL